MMMIPVYIQASFVKYIGKTNRRLLDQPCLGTWMRCAGCDEWPCPACPASSLSSCHLLNPAKDCRWYCWSYHHISRHLRMGGDWGSGSTRHVATELGSKVMCGVFSQTSRGSTSIYLVNRKRWGVGCACVRVLLWCPPANYC